MIFLSSLWYGTSVLLCWYSLVSIMVSCEIHREPPFFPNFNQLRDNTTAGMILGGLAFSFVPFANSAISVFGVFCIVITMLFGIFSFVVELFDGDNFKWLSAKPFERNNKQ